MSLADASVFNSVFLGATATGAKSLYQRKGYNLVDSSLEKALELGTLKTDQTQLSATATLSRGNASHYYSFTLDGDNLKIDLSNTYGTDAVRIQLYNSSGKVIADSHGATEALKNAFKDLWSADGLDTKAGEYTIRSTYAPTASRATNQTYILSLYSGVRFSSSYQTTAVSQTSLNQKVTVDNTLTFATTNAQEYSTQGVHYVGATVSDAINIGWLFENKSALKVSSQLTQVSDDHNYSMTLQKGEKLKMAFTNKTDTSELRVKVTDTTGMVTIADSHGTEKQKAAYEKLVSSEGMDAKQGKYVFNVTYADGVNKTKGQNYEFYVYSGQRYTSLYETLAATENVNTALLTGHLSSGMLNYKAVTSNYLSSQILSDDTGLLSVLQMIKNY